MNALRVLAVEDNPADFRLLTEYLGGDLSSNFEVTCAGTLKEALEMLSTGKFAAVLLDLNLPDSSGLEGVEKIVGLKPSPPVIVLTGAGNETTGLLALSKNAQDYLVKGKIDGDSLVRSIRYAIERNKAEEAARQLNVELEKRAADILSANKALQDSRAAALNLMEDAVEARQEAERAAAELRESEQRLAASLQEKEVLLKEIHHRVKNNLQVISSLVSLQADALADPALRGVFQDVRDRVRSMALVHENLYKSASLDRVDFADYTRSLLQHLWRGQKDAAGFIRLTLELQPVTLPVENAVPCGLILNELATNALKHAFDGRAEGEVRVALSLEPDGRVCLCVGDNGVGLPAGLDWRESSTLGLKLVRMLTSQLNGTVDVSTVTGGGTQFTLLFTRQGDGSGHSIVPP